MISRSTHLENIKGIVPQGPETICTPPLWTWLSKTKSISNRFALGSLRTHLKREQFAALTQLFCTLLALRRGGPTELRGSSTTMWISTGCVCSPLHCREINMYMRGPFSACLTHQTMMKYSNNYYHRSDLCSCLYLIVSSPSLCVFAALTPHGPIKGLLSG